jgi:hypothetical protein
VKVEDLNTAAKRYQRYVLTCILALFGSALLCVIIYAPFQKRIETRLSNVPLGEVLSVVPMGLGLLIAFAALIPVSRRVDRKFGVPCPHCGTSLIESHRIVIASRNCFHCGKRVLEEP